MQNNLKNFQTKICPQCGAPRMKDWRDLSEERKMLVERLPRNTEFTKEERKKHRFCEQCFYEEIEPRNQIA